MSSLQARELNIFVEKGIESKPRYLRYDFNALADFEQINGMGLGQLLSMKAVFGTVRAMLWAGCKGDDPSLTIQGAGQLIGDYIRAGGAIDEDCRVIRVGLLEDARNFGECRKGVTPSAVRDKIAEYRRIFPEIWSNI